MAPLLDPALFLAHIREHEGILRKVAGAYARQRDDREELTQEILAQLWRAYPRYDAGRRFSTWMFRVALNVAIAHCRSRVRRERFVALDVLAEEPEGEESATADHLEQRRRLQAFIARLDELHRALVILYLEDTSYRDIAEILGISETNVATKLNRLRHSLRTELNPEPPPVLKEDSHGTR